MKTYIKAAALAVFLLSLACCREQDPLETVRLFRPGEKHFKAVVANMHFIIETSRMARIDTNFARMIRMHQIPMDASKCADGVFVGESAYDAYDYKHRIQLKIENGKIIQADYDEIHRNGSGKEHDETYCHEMEPSGTTPAIAYPAMEKELLEKQDYMKVDGVSGASYSKQRFRYATMIALMKGIVQNMPPVQKTVSGNEN